MTISLKSKKGRGAKEQRPVLNLDNDLLGFVNALEELNVPEDAETFETFADLSETEDSTSKTKNDFKKSKNPAKVAKSLASSADADFDDFTAVLDVDDSGFSGLKKRISVIKGEENAEEDESSSKKIKKKIKVVEAPLPNVQQKQIDRSIAYEKTVKDVSKWSGIIQKNRDADQLVFPLINQQASANVSSHTMVSTFTPTTDLEKEIADLIQRDGVSATPSSEDTSSELPVNHLDPDQLYKEISKIRSSKFFSEIKNRRQAKIKSKKYRKMLAKERMKAEAVAIASGNLSELSRLGLMSSTAEDSEIRRERRMKAEMDRARERLTLRTRKVNKWAQELLNKRHGDADGRLKVLEQIREKERLRQEIYGAGENMSDEEDDLSESDNENEEDVIENGEEEDENFEDEIESHEVQEIFDSVKAEHEVITGRYKIKSSEEVRITNSNDSENDSLDEEIHNSIIKQQKTNKTSSNGVRQVAVKDDFDRTENENETEADDGSNVSRWQIQKNLIREAFEDDEVFADFEAEKKNIVEAEAPKAIDVTLPGWGVWGGFGISAEDSIPKSKKFVVHKNGLDPRARLDRNLKHVIINERRIKAAAKAFTIPKTPFPFTSSDMHARHIAQPIGKEWNTVTSYKKRIQPKVVTKAGQIIKPIKFFKQSKHI